MSSIEIPRTITQAPDYSQALYENLINKATASNVAAATVNELLCGAIAGGKSFSQALALVLEQPALTPPKNPEMALLKDWVGMPSPGALIMSTTTEYAAEQRRQNQELMWKETETLTASMRDQATKMREAAKQHLIMSAVSGALQIVMGALTVRVANADDNLAKEAADAAAAGAKAGSEAFSATMMKYNIDIGAAGQIFSGASKEEFDAGAQHASAEMQAMGAGQMMKAMRESIRNVDEAVHALIQKSLAAQNDIQASTNQARTKILA
jgi:hypothetical protein